MVFDLDGTIVDTELIYKEIFMSFLNDKGFPLTDEEYLNFPGSNMPKNYKFILKKYDNFFPSYQEFIDEYLIYKEKGRIDYLANASFNVIECIEQLHQMGYRLALASSSDMTHINEVIDALDLQDYFEYKVTGHDFKESKPHPEIYEFTCGLFGEAPENCWAVEDSTFGILAAKTAGMKVIARKDEHFNLDQTQADYIIEDMLDIIEIVEDDENEKW